MSPAVDLYPLRPEPRLHRRVWGGDRLPALHRGDPPRLGPEGEPVGESWLAGDDNVVLNGAHAGRTLAELARALGAALVGGAAVARYGARLPLLAKLLDAAADLSVQVHPDDAYALSEEAASGHLGKAEAWYVLAAEPGASVLWGFARDVSREEVACAAADGTLPALMNRVPVAPGTVVVNPAGTVHAVGAGVRLYEIQQASDLTYRLYDHGRRGADGRPRTLHLERGLAVADLRGAAWAPPEPRVLGGGWQRLVARPEFVLDRAELAGAAVAGRPDPASLQLVTLTRGRARLAPAEPEAAWEPLALAAGDTVLLPAGLAGGYLLEGSGEALRSAMGWA
ncbi:MAG: mannose-6-phosphate isomerase [Deinococcales bacterium]|nr:mannose-6-phosphate isomerase [Deinococcales bacterium]